MAGLTIRALAGERPRWLLWVPVGFGAGVALYFALPFEPPLWAAPGLAASAAAAARLARRNPAIAIPLLAVAIAAAGAAAAGLRTASVAAPILAAEHGPATIRGTVLAVEPRTVGYRAVIAVDEIERLAPEATPERVRLNIRTGAPPPPGRPISVLAVLMPPPGPTAPGAYDFARALFFQRIGTVGYAVGPPEGGAAAPGGWRESLAAFRLAISERIAAAMTEGRPDDAEAQQRAHVASALLTGLRGGIDESIWAALRDAGLAHLLAISGLHMALVAGIVFTVLRFLLACAAPLALRYPIKKWAAAAALAAAFAYLLMTGATVPTRRAWIMAAFVLGAVMLDREPLTLRPVAWAALAILALNPESLAGPSFQMSFAAVTALVAAYEAMRAARLRRGASPPRQVWRPLVYIGGVAATTLIASLATAPFAAYHFNRVALFGLAANLVAVPATALWIMPCGLAALLAMPFGLEAPALELMGQGIRVVIAVARAGADLPGAAALVPSAPPAALAATVLGGLWLAIWRKPLRFLGLGGIAAGVLIAAAARGPDILVSDDGRLFAVRPPSGGLALSRHSARNFDARNWLRRAGAASAAPWPAEHGACDSLGCIYAPPGGPRVALVRDSRALAEDCAFADIVVSAVPARDCGAARVIDRRDLRRDGAHAIRFRGGGRAEITHVRGARGARPWAPERSPRGQ